MTFTRLEPWSLRDLVNRDIDKGCTADRGASADGDCAADWTPAVDVIEAADRFLLRADVPGVEPADIDVSIDKDILCISGERTAVAGADDAKTRIERATGRFSRRFTLPAAAVDAEGVKARCRNGILEVVIPKSPAVQARRITVRAARAGAGSYRGATKCRSAASFEDVRGAQGRLRSQSIQPGTSNLNIARLFESQLVIEALSEATNDV